MKKVVMEKDSLFAEHERLEKEIAELKTVLERLRLDRASRANERQRAIATRESIAFLALTGEDQSANEKLINARRQCLEADQAVVEFDSAILAGVAKLESLQAQSKKAFMEAKIRELDQLVESFITEIAPLGEAIYQQQKDLQGKIAVYTKRMAGICYELGQDSFRFSRLPRVVSLSIQQRIAPQNLGGNKADDTLRTDTLEEALRRHLSKFETINKAVNE